MLKIIDLKKLFYMKTNLKNYLPLLVLLFTISFSFGQSINYSLQDLVGVKGSGAENALEDRGYKHIKTKKSDNNFYTYWWKS